MFSETSGFPVFAYAKEGKGKTLYGVGHICFRGRKELRIALKCCFQDLHRYNGRCSWEETGTWEEKNSAVVGGAGRKEKSKRIPWTWMDEFQKKPG